MKSSELNRVSFIVMRELRAPLMTLLIVYSIGMLVMTFIPGIEIDGEVQHLSIFHAFYFMTYTATTTGFGELPVEFSNAQRLWAIICLYVSVVAWFYALGSIIKLFQNTFFLRALAEWRFTKSVARITGPFYIICGFGDTGSVLVRGLNDAGMNAVVIDSNAERIQALSLRSYRIFVPGLCADASVPSHLLDAGVSSPYCKAVVSITNDEAVNLQISALARLLNPSVCIITMSKAHEVEDTLATLGGEIHIVDPFKTFAKVLNACINKPAFYALNNWLVGSRGASLEVYEQPPIGHWIICGYGRMGMEANHALNLNHINTAVIDPHSRRRDEEIETYIEGRACAKTLKDAGIDHAVGLLAAADDDGQNLSVLLNARRLNDDLFTIVRQNSHQNEIAFNIANANMVMQPTLVTARKILLLLIAPLLKHFFIYLLAKDAGRDQILEALITRLKQRLGHKKPFLVTVNFNRSEGLELVNCLEAGHTIFLGDIIKDSRYTDKALDLVPFVIKSGDQEIILPTDDYKIKIDDQLLFCGTVEAKQLFKANINSEYTLFYLRTGKYPAVGYFMQWYESRLRKKNGNNYD